MIIRDSKESISGTAQNARQRLGDVLKHYRLERDLSHREVSRRLKVAIGLVERYESGDEVPGSDEWKAYCRGVARGLNGFQELYQRARKEAEDDAKERGRRNARIDVAPTVTTKINSALGDKLAALPAPQPEPEEQETVPETKPQLTVVPTEPAKNPNGRIGKPPGSYTAAAQERRKAFVRDLVRQRPRIRTQGSDSVVEAVRKAFGIGISPEAVEEIREELRKEQIKAEIMRDLPPPAPPTLPAMAAQLMEHVTQAAPTLPPAPVQQHEPNEADIATAVQLILESLPGLQTFTITVDEHGEASVDFQIRKVKVETVGGSIKVKR